MCVFVLVSLAWLVVSYSTPRAGADKATMFMYHISSRVYWKATAGWAPIEAYLGWAIVKVMIKPGIVDGNRRWLQCLRARLCDRQLDGWLPKVCQFSSDSSSYSIQAGLINAPATTKLGRCLFRPIQPT